MSRLKTSILLSALLFGANTTEGTDGFVDNYKVCQALTRRLARLPRSEKDEIYVAKFYESVLTEPRSSKEEDTHSFRPIVRPATPGTALSTLYVGRDGKFKQATPNTHPTVLEVPTIQYEEVTIEPRPLDRVTFNVSREGLSTRLSHPHFRQWLQSGFNALKTRVQTGSTATGDEVVAFSLPQNVHGKLIEEVGRDIARETKSSLAESLVHAYPRLHVPSEDPSFFFVGALGRLFSGVSLGLTAGIYSDMLLPGFAVAAAAAIIPPHKIIRWTTGYSPFALTPISTRFLSNSHDGGYFFSQEETHEHSKIGFRTSDGLELIMANGQVLAWFPKDSHYASLFETSKPGRRTREPAADPTPVAEQPVVVSTEAKAESAPVDAGAIREKTQARLAHYSPILTDISPEAVHAALKLNDLGNELRGQVLERDSLIDAAMTALIAKEHLLVFGPSGNAKTTTFKALLSAFVDAAGNPSFSKQQIKHDTSEAELFGPFSPSRLLNNDVYERLTEQSFLSFRHVILDEVLDIRPSSRRDLLEALEERVYSHAGKTHGGIIETVVGITNKFIPNILVKANGQLDMDARALIDRFALFYYLGWEFEKAQSDMDLVGRSRKEVRLKPMLFSEKEQLIQLARSVPIPDSVRLAANLVWESTRGQLEPRENQAIVAWRQALFEGKIPDPPYLTTRVFSPRGKLLSGSVLRASAVLDWAKAGAIGAPELTVSSLAHQEKSITAMDSSEELLRHRLAATSDPNERVQIQAILQDRGEFRSAFTTLESGVQNHFLTQGIAEIAKRSRSGSREREVVLQNLQELHALIDAAESRLPNLSRPLSEQNADGVAALQAKERGYRLLAEIVKGGVPW